MNKRDLEDDNKPEYNNDHLEVKIKIKNFKKLAPFTQQQHYKEYYSKYEAKARDYADKIKKLNKKMNNGIRQLRKDNNPLNKDFKEGLKKDIAERLNLREQEQVCIELAKRGKEIHDSYTNLEK